MRMRIGMEEYSVGMRIRTEDENWNGGIECRNEDKSGDENWKLPFLILVLLD